MAKELISGAGLNMDFVAGRHPIEPWNPGWGQESIHRYMLSHLKPGDRVLDLCSGFGRASLPLAMRGARVTLVDSDPEVLDYAAAKFKSVGISENLERTVTTNVMDLSADQVGKFRFILACNAVTHMLKSHALALISKLSRFAHPGGALIYADGPSKFSWEYALYQENFAAVEPDTFEDMCGCSGEQRLEPFPFFGPGEIEYCLRKQGASVIHAGDYPAPSPGNFNREVIVRLPQI